MVSIPTLSFVRYLSIPSLIKTIRYSSYNITTNRPFLLSRFILSANTAELLVMAVEVYGLQWSLTIALPVMLTGWQRKSNSTGELHHTRTWRSSIFYIWNQGSKSRIALPVDSRWRGMDGCGFFLESQSNFRLDVHWLHQLASRQPS